MKKSALCIGINDYPGTGSDLSGCINDVNDWAKVFTDRGFQVQKLQDKQATKKAILDAMASLIENAAKGDSIIFQYSGHGTYIPDDDGDEADGTDECLCPHDLNTKGPITDDELYELYLSKKPGVKLVVFSDSCHSGSVTRFAPIQTPPPVTGKNPPVRKVRFLPPSVFLSKKDLDKLGTINLFRSASPPGRYGSLLFAGCQDNEYSYDAYFNNRPNGAFTYVALETLKKLKPTATYQEWFRMIRSILPSQQYPQSPNIFGSKTMKKWKIFA
ncbi:MAG TPA: caspase family protein [Flavitalea sp.]|nr:caspase family protein [Flavitalea sp.]